MQATTKLVLPFKFLGLCSFVVSQLALLCSQVQFLDWLEKNRSLSVAEVCNSTRGACHWNTTAELNATNPELFYLSWQFQYEWGAIWCESPRPRHSHVFTDCVRGLQFTSCSCSCLCSRQTRTSRRSWPS